jgi:hypothetical protein
MSPITKIKKERDDARAEADKLAEEMKKVIAHTGLPLHPTDDLLLGLLDSVQRIARAALAAHEEGRGK